MDSEKKLAIHESSHAIVSKLLKDYVPISRLTLSKDLASEGSYNQDNIASISVEPICFGKDGYVAIGIVLLAGIVGQNIAKKNPHEILLAKPTILENPNSLDLEFAGGDMTRFGQNSQLLETLYRFSPKKYEHFCFDYLIDYLTDSRVWVFVEKLSAVVLEKESKTLDEKELEDFFTESGYEKFLADNRQNFLKRLTSTAHIIKPDHDYDLNVDAPLF